MNPRLKICVSSAFYSFLNAEDTDASNADLHGLLSSILIIRLKMGFKQKPQGRAVKTLLHLAVF